MSYVSLYMYIHAHTHTHMHMHTLVCMFENRVECVCNREIEI